MSDLIVRTSWLRSTGSAVRYLAGALRAAEEILEDHQRSVGHRRPAHQLDEMQADPGLPDGCTPPSSELPPVPAAP